MRTAVSPVAPLQRSVVQWHSLPVKALISYKPVFMILSWSCWTSGGILSVVFGNKLHMPLDAL